MIRKRRSLLSGAGHEGGDVPTSTLSRLPVKPAWVGKSCSPDHTIDSPHQTVCREEVRQGTFREAIQRGGTGWLHDSPLLSGFKGQHSPFSCFRRQLSFLVFVMSRPEVLVFNPCLLRENKKSSIRQNLSQWMPPPDLILAEWPLLNLGASTHKGVCSMLSSKGSQGSLKMEL